MGEKSFNFDYNDNRKNFRKNEKYGNNDESNIEYLKEANNEIYSAYKKEKASQAKAHQQKKSQVIETTKKELQNLKPQIKR